MCILNIHSLKKNSYRSFFTRDLKIICSYLNQLILLIFSLNRLKKNLVYMELECHFQIEISSRFKLILTPHPLSLLYILVSFTIWTFCPSLIHGCNLSLWSITVKYSFLWKIRGRRKCLNTFLSYFFKLITTGFIYVDVL